MSSVSSALSAPSIRCGEVRKITSFVWCITTSGARLEGNQTWMTRHDQGSSGLGYSTGGVFGIAADAQRRCIWKYSSTLGCGHPDWLVVFRGMVHQEQ